MKLHQLEYSIAEKLILLLLRNVKLYKFINFTINMQIYKHQFNKNK